MAERQHAVRVRRRVIHRAVHQHDLVVVGRNTVGEGGNALGGGELLGPHLAAPHALGPPGGARGIEHRRHPPDRTGPRRLRVAPRVPIGHPLRHARQFGRMSPMFYTSGTTGPPKGARRGQLRPEQLAAAERVSTLAYGIAPNDDQVVLMNGPMYHSAPNSYGMLAFRHGCTIVLEPRFDPEDLLRLVQEFRISHMHAVPTMFVRLLRLPGDVRKRYDVSSLRFVIHGAAPCPIDVKRAMIEWWGPVINEYLGSTETGIPVWHSSAEALAKPGTVGRAIEGGIVKIFRPDGTECDVGEPGEIFMRQTAIADFDYHGNAAARAEAGRDGLVSAGDVGY